jgi:hypothetical protein
MRMIVKRVQAPRESGVGHERKLRYGCGRRQPIDKITRLSDFVSTNITYSPKKCFAGRRSSDTGSIPNSIPHRSYVNEGFFYRELAFPLLDEGVGVPEPLLVEGDGAGQLTLVRGVASTPARPP